LVLSTAQKLEKKLDAEFVRVANANASLNQANIEIDRLRALMDEQAEDHGREELDAENVELNKQLGILKADISNLNAQIAAYQRELKKLESEHDASEAELKERLKELRSVQETLSAERKETEAVAKRAAERESTLKSQLQEAFDATATKDQVGFGL